MDSTSDIKQYRREVLSASLTLFAMFLLSISVPRFSWLWWVAASLLMVCLIYINVIYLKIFKLAIRE